MKTASNLKVAELRKTIGRTQEQFAIMLGISKDTIVSVENGRNRLSGGLAHHIHVATGADTKSLLANKGPITFTMSYGSNRGTFPYTRESFVQWRKEVYAPRSDDPEGRRRAAEFFFDHIKGRLEVLLIAATIPGIRGRDRFASVVQSLESWIQRAYEDFDLAKEVDGLLDGTDWDSLYIPPPERKKPQRKSVRSRSWNYRKLFDNN